MGCGASTNQPVGVDRRQQPTLAGSLQRTALPLPPSQPVSAPTNYRHGSPITKAQLDSLRSTFWSTRVEGSMNMWLALKSASEALLEKDVMMANAVLGASNITTPNGNLSLCYDEMGDVYKIPDYCFSDPIELHADRDRAGSSNGLFKGFMMTSVSAKSNAPSVLHVVDTPITVRVKVNPSDVLLLIETNSTNTVDDLKKSIYEKTVALRNKEPSDDAQRPPLCEERRQRLIFMGKELKSGQLLGDVGVDDSRVIQVFLRKEEVEKTAHTVC